MEKDFLELISPDAFRAILSGFAPLGVANVALDQACGRFLARDVRSPEDLPVFARSGMDGYAVLARDVYAASESNPSYLDLAGESDICAVPTGPLRPGTCLKVVTGSSLPPGADAVVMVEHTQHLGGETIEIRKPVAPGENMMLAREDAAAGETVLGAGTLVRPAEIGLLAALGVERVGVRARPRVAIFSTGDELVDVSASPRPGQIRDANGPALAAMCAQAGALPEYLGIVPDDVAAIAAAMEKALARADVVLLSGGSSVGARDLTIEALGVLPDTIVLAHGLAVSPGKPTIVASSRGKAVWGLPGQMASAQVVMLVFGCPFLAHLAGDAAAFSRPRPWTSAKLARNVASRQGREDFIRVRLSESAGATVAHPVLGKSGLLKTLLQAQGLIRIPAGLEGLEAGETVQVALL